MISFLNFKELARVCRFPIWTEPSISAVHSNLKSICWLEELKKTMSVTKTNEFFKCQFNLMIRKKYLRKFAEKCCRDHFISFKSFSQILFIYFHSVLLFPKWTKRKYLNRWRCRSLFFHSFLERNPSKITCQYRFGYYFWWKKYGLLF